VRLRHAALLRCCCCCCGGGGTVAGLGRGAGGGGGEYWVARAVAGWQTGVRLGVWCRWYRSRRAGEGEVLGVCGAAGADEVDDGN